jgi:hypothetical protein
MRPRTSAPTPLDGGQPPRLARVMSAAELSPFETKANCEPGSEMSLPFEKNREVRTEKSDVPGHHLVSGTLSVETALYLFGLIPPGTFLAGERTQLPVASTHILPSLHRTLTPSTEVVAPCFTSSPASPVQLVGKVS